MQKLLVLVTLLVLSAAPSVLADDPDFCAAGFCHSAGTASAGRCGSPGGFHSGYNVVAGGAGPVGIFLHGQGSCHTTSSYSAGEDGIDAFVMLDGTGLAYVMWHHSYTSTADGTIEGCSLEFGTLATPPVWTACPAEASPPPASWGSLLP